MDWDVKVKEALERTEFMAISTVGSDGSWTCPVQFGYDDKLCLYFKSMPQAKHMRNLAADPRISVAIFKTDRFDDGEVLGLQLKGTAKVLTERAEVEEACLHYYSRGPRRSDYTSRVDEHLGATATWNFVKIFPKEAWCFDSREFDEERRQIDFAGISIKLGY